MLQTTTTLSNRQRIRRLIEPPDGWSPGQKPFKVGWCTHPLTFPEIMADLKSNILKALKYLRKMAPQYFPDLLQQGWLRLWKALHEDDQLLANMSHFEAVNFVSNRCGASNIRSYLVRYGSYHDFTEWEHSQNDVYEDHITEIVIGSSLKSSGRSKHALFTRTVDRIIDIAKAIRQVADWCGDDIRKLAALYYVTTKVNQADAGRIAGLKIYKPKDRNHRCQGLYRYSKMVLDKLREVLQEYLPIEPNRDHWKDQIKAGNLEPVVKLAQKYTNDADKLLGLYCLTTNVGRETLVKELGLKDGTFWYTVDQLRQELRWMYARRVPTPS